MSVYERVLKEIDVYQSRYRRGDVPPLRIGGLYDLSPELGQPQRACEAKWDQQWPNSDESGVYVFFDHDLSVLYIGKARILGARLAAYCAYGPGKTCRLKHEGWSRTPRYVLTVAVPGNMPWEAAALEEYLIRALDPPDNVLGRLPAEPVA